MKYALALLPLYLSCAAPKEIKSPIVIIELENNPIVMEDEPIEVQRLLPKEPPAKKAADYIVKTLEGKIKETGKSYAHGEITGVGHNDYILNYAFDPRTTLCEVGSGKQVANGSLYLHFQEGLYVANGTSSQTIIDFETVQPFYVATNFRYYHVEFLGNGIAIDTLNLYPIFPEAQKMYEEMLLYIAEELKHGSLIIRLGTDKISIEHTDQELLGEENLLKSYEIFKEAFPKHHPYPEAKITLLKHCDP